MRKIVFQQIKTQTLTICAGCLFFSEQITFMSFPFYTYVCMYVYVILVANPLKNSIRSKISHNMEKAVDIYFCQLLLLMIVAVRQDRYRDYKCWSMLYYKLDFLFKFSLIFNLIYLLNYVICQIYDMIQISQYIVSFKKCLFVI